MFKVAQFLRALKSQALKTHRSVSAYPLSLLTHLLCTPTYILNYSHSGRPSACKPNELKYFLFPCLPREPLPLSKALHSLRSHHGSVWICLPNHVPSPWLVCAHLNYFYSSLWPVQCCTCESKVNKEWRGGRKDKEEKERGRERKGRGKEKREGKRRKGKGRKRKASHPTETSFHGFPKIFPLGDIKRKRVWNLGPQQDSKDTLHTLPSMDISKSLHMSAVCFGEWWGCYWEDPWNVIPFEESYKSAARSLLTYFLNILWWKF